MKLKYNYTRDEKVGECTFIRPCEEFDAAHAVAYFRCQCGEIFVAYVFKIKSKQVTSCGCRIVQNNKHRRIDIKGVNQVEYRIWQHMKERCNNPRHVAYANYGGRGIVVCDRWKKDFLNFLSDMGKRPSKEHSLDRIEVNGNYEPTNCRWANTKEQNRNKRNSVYYMYNGKKMLIQEIADEVKLPEGRIRARLKKGFTVEESVDPKIYNRHNKQKVS